MKDEHLRGIARTMRYDELCRTFRWDLPETFNFAGDVVDAWAATGDPLALIWQNEAGEAADYRFSDIARLSCRLASALAAAGVAKGDRVIVMLPRIPEWQVSLVACLRLGAVPIPCIEMLTARDLDYRVENSGAKAVICRTEHAGKLAASADRVPVRVAIGPGMSPTPPAAGPPGRAQGESGVPAAGDIPPGWLSWAEALAAGTDTFAPVRVGIEDPAVMYYTSGSTGHPKGVLHAARALYAWRMQAYLWLDLEPGDRIWCTADTGWSKAGTSVIWGPWSTGATAFQYDGPFVPAERLRLIAERRITVYCASSTELLRLAGENPGAYDLASLRRTVSAGEAVSPVVADRWERATGCLVSEAYGQTEALMMVLNYPSEPVRRGSMGRPQPGLDMDIVDDAGRRLGVGEEGHVALRAPSPQLMLGYWGEPERTAQCFIEGPEGRWYLSGDRGRKDADGYFWYEGRADDVINSAGYRIGPLEVENVLLEHPAVAECAVVASPDPDRGEIVKAFVVLRPGFAGDAGLVRALQDHVKATTAPYKYPRAIAFIDEIPKTVTGKVRRRTLKDLEWGRPAATP
jgi:acyl-coenzyme A synthetase/AMP-(fatty) acid ligase